MAQVIEIYSSLLYSNEHLSPSLERIMITSYMLLHRASYADAAHLLVDPAGPIQQLLTSNSHLRMSAAEWIASPEQSLYRRLNTNVLVFRNRIEDTYHGTLEGIAREFCDTPLDRYEQDLLMTAVSSASDLAEHLGIVWEYPTFERSGSS